MHSVGCGKLHTTCSLSEFPFASVKISIHQNNCYENALHLHVQVYFQANQPNSTWTCMAYFTWSELAGKRDENTNQSISPNPIPFGKE